MLGALNPTKLNICSTWFSLKYIQKPWFPVHHHDRLVQICFLLYLLCAWELITRQLLLHNCITYCFDIHCVIQTGVIEDMAMSSNGELCVTVATDKNAKVFDVVNFGMWYHIILTNQSRLTTFQQGCQGWLQIGSDL